MVFCFVQKNFSDKTRVRIFISFVAQSANFFSQNSTLGYMTKTLNQIIFFSSTKIRTFFQQHWESEYSFRKKNHTPPFKLNGRSLSFYTICFNPPPQLHGSNQIQLTFKKGFRECYDIYHQMCLLIRLNGRQLFPYFVYSLI